MSYRCGGAVVLVRKVHFSGTTPELADIAKIVSAWNGLLPSSLKLNCGWDAEPVRHVLKCGLRGAASFSASTLILNPWLFLEFKLGDVGELTFSECWRYRLRLGPDLSMIGYAANAQVGATAYTYAFPLILTAYGLGSGHHIVLAVAVIWIAHIGLDRLLGYGLKYPTYFKDTHLSPSRKALPD